MFRKRVIFYIAINWLIVACWFDGLVDFQDYYVVLLSPSELDPTMKLILQVPIWAARVIYIQGSALKDSDLSRCRLTLYGRVKIAEQRTIIRQYGDWYTGRWWVGCYIWYSEEGPGEAATPPSPLIAVPNVTAHPSTAGVPTSYRSMRHYNYLCTLIHGTQSTWRSRYAMLVVLSSVHCRFDGHISKTKQDRPIVTMEHYTV